MTRFTKGGFDGSGGQSVLFDCLKRCFIEAIKFEKQAGVVPFEMSGFSGFDNFNVMPLNGGGHPGKRPEQGVAVTTGLVSSVSSGLVAAVSTFADDVWDDKTQIACTAERVIFGRCLESGQLRSDNTNKAAALFKS